MPKKYLLSVIISILTILILPVSALPVSADYSAETNASTRYVATSGTDSGTCTDSATPCRTIQYAINQSASGDTIKVAAGTYTYVAASDICPTDQTKSVVCTYQKALTLLGGYTTSNWLTAYPALNQAIIDGQNTYRGIRHYSYTSASQLLVMEGFTIRNGRSTGTSSLPAIGGGLLAQRTSLILRDMIFENNRVIGFDTGTNAGGTADGAAIRIQSEDALHSTALLQRVIIQNNQSNGGTGTERGGIAFGAFYIYRATGTIEDSSFLNNLAEAGDSAGDGRTADWMHADALGGGITVMNASLTLNRVNVVDNEIRGGDANSSGYGGGAYGGGIFVEGVNDGQGLAMSTISMSDCYVAYNMGTSGRAGTGGNTAGGGFDAVDSRVTIDRSQFIGNQILGGDGTTTRAGIGAGGGLYIWALTAGIPRATLRNVIIADNYANQGGGVTFVGNGNGGGLVVQGIGADITHATFARNGLGPLLRAGQALYVTAWSSLSGNVNLSHSIISDHTVGQTTPAAVIIASNSSLTFDQGLFAGNLLDTENYGTMVGKTTMINRSTAGYVSPGSPHYNYHLRGDSPARDPVSGSTLSVDYEGQARPYPLGGTTDYGADEYRSFYLAAGIGDSSLRLNWSVDSGFLTGGVSYYQVVVNYQPGANPPTQGTTINVGTATSITLTGLSNLKWYSVIINAYDASAVLIASSDTITATPTDIQFFLPFLFK